jgi:hypothetical protein
MRSIVKTAQMSLEQLPVHLKQFLAAENGYLFHKLNVDVSCNTVYQKPEMQNDEINSKI